MENMRRGRIWSRNAGVTLIEVSMGIAVLVTAVLGFSKTMVMIEQAHQRTREVGLASQAARQVLERIQSVSYAEAFRRFNGDASDDPGGAGTAPGMNFAVPGLSAVAGDPDGLPGEILFPTPNGQPGVLRENVADAALGMPRDLNGDGFVSAVANYSTTYTILPVRVRVRWVSSSGPGVYELRTLLGNY
jgi:hypothetical protein